MCPNRNELLVELFNPIYLKNKNKKWHLSFEFDFKQEKEFEEDEGKKKIELKNLFISSSKKLFFLPSNTDNENETVHGFFMLIKRNDQDCNELMNEEIKLYPLTVSDVSKYMPPLSDEMIKKLTKNHMISYDNERFVRAKWKELLTKKIEKGFYLTFRTEGYNRLKHQTTGSVYGCWV